MKEGERKKKKREIKGRARENKRDINRDKRER